MARAMKRRSVARGGAMTMTRWQRGVAAILAAALIQGSQPGHAEPQTNTDSLKQELAMIVASISLARASMAHCDTVSPESRKARQAGLDAWRAANQVDAFET